MGGTSFASMAGLVVDRTLPPAHPRLPARPSHRVVLVAVAFGLLFGAVACAAGLAGGAAHSASQPSVLEIDGLQMAHAGHLAPTVDAGSQRMPPGGHGDHSGSSSMAGGHPGMACVVSVDLHFPEASPAAVSDSFEVPLVGMRTGCPADVDPPVPRFS